MMKSFVSGLTLATMLVCSTTMAETDTQPVLWFADASDTGGLSHLTRTDDAVLVSVEIAGLPPGDAVTLWWVVFNNPAGCGAACGDDEFDENGPGFGPAQVAVGNASGNVVKSNGTLEFGGVLRKMTNDDHQILFGAGGDGEFLLTVDPDEAEIHIVAQTHGQARGGKKLREQLAFFEANCTPSCADVQFAVHQP